MEQEKNNVGLLRPLQEAGLTYSLAAILPAVLSVILSLILGAMNATSGTAARYLSFLLPQISFAGIALIYFRRSKVSPREMYSPCKWTYFVVALVMEFGLLFCLGELNGLFAMGLEKLGYRRTLTEDFLPPLSGWNLLPALLIIAVLPAIFEETVFRGVLTGTMGRSGWSTAAVTLISGALFSLFHHNPEQTVYQFICGVCYALLALRAGSVLPSMLAHLCNNALILFLTAFGGLNEEGALLLSGGGYIALVVTAGVSFIAAILFLLLTGKRKGARGAKGGTRFFLFAAAGVILCAIEWILQLVEGCV